MNASWESGLTQSKPSRRMSKSLTIALTALVRNLQLGGQYQCELWKSQTQILVTVLHYPMARVGNTSITSAEQQQRMGHGASHPWDSGHQVNFQLLFVWCPNLTIHLKRQPWRPTCALDE